jgi:hypothetical protein
VEVALLLCDVDPLAVRPFRVVRAAEPLVELAQVVVRAYIRGVGGDQPLEKSQGPVRVALLQVLCRQGEEGEGIVRLLFVELEQHRQPLGSHTESVIVFLVKPKARPCISPPESIGLHREESSCIFRIIKHFTKQVVPDWV